MPVRHFAPAVRQHIPFGERIIEEIKLFAVRYKQLAGPLTGGDRVLITREDGSFLMTPEDNEGFYLPNYPPLGTYNKIKQGYPSVLYNIYTSDGFVEVEDGDIVVDGGAFVGGFSLAASRAGAVHVYAVEPSPDNYKALLKNTADDNRIETSQAALWNENKTLEFEVANDGTESGIVSDAGGQIISVPGKTVQTFVEEMDLDNIDFLKLDAEGFEPEVLEGIGDLQISKLSVACGAERNNRFTREQVAEKLISRGYEIEKHRSHVFAKQL